VLHQIIEAAGLHGVEHADDLTTMFLDQRGDHVVLGLLVGSQADALDRRS
jgi:hypothetical protein